MNRVRVSMNAAAQVLDTMAFLFGKNPKLINCNGPICWVSVRNDVSMAYSRSPAKACAPCFVSPDEIDHRPAPNFLGGSD